jgi:hypothetical protein
MNNFIVPIILLALYATFGYYQGKEKKQLDIRVGQQRA